MTDLVDSNRLAYTGGAPSGSAQARAMRAWGWWAFAEYRLRSMRAYLTTLVLAGLVQPLVYLLAMGVGLGAMIDSGGGGIGGVPYLQFVTPGILVATLVMSASGESTWPVMSGFKWERSYFATVATPVSPRQIVTGLLTAIGLRLTVQGLLFWGCMVAFGATGPGWSVIMVPLGALAGLAFAAPVAAYVATLEDEGLHLNFLHRFVVMPMFLFAGTFFPLESMPGYLQWIGWISPMWHGTQLARIASYGMPNPDWLTAVHLGCLLGLLVFGWWAAGRTFAKRLVG